MEPNRNHMSNDCDMSGIKPAIFQLLPLFLSQFYSKNQ